MAAFNRVVLMGNLTRDPELRHTSGGTAMSTVGLAINREWVDKRTDEKKKETTFIDVTLWGRDAEIVCEYLAKGRQLLIEGRLQMEQWDDKTTGQKRSKLTVVAEQITIVGHKGES